MSDLLTRGEYKAIAAGLTLPVQAFVDGSFRPAQSGKTFDSVNPATGACVDAPCLASMIFDLSAGSSIGRVSGL
ncbi:hypothetical protein [Mameliella alba]|uniref:Aldehyde dehydrogenase n=1 Tax=Mameliella alba TaxID=561184 RepID=A0A0B3RF63_9RHOB|nr:hypothetical protein [Mameliella alba]KHQ49880.1 Aldehyde dehydrogenase [Mameliella alba]